MLKLENLKKDAQIRGILPEQIVRIVQVEPIGDHALTAYYKDSQGQLGEQMLFRTDEARLELAQAGRPWAFDADGAAFKLGLEAYRISQAALFDPMMAVHTSNVEPLPHQIAAVYEAMLPKQPLRFVLADDPGAGKTIMAGLLVRELLMRADARRILIVAPGGLTEQWQDELLEKFGLRFEIFSREQQEQCASGNYFDEQDQLICRLDQLSRNEDVQAKLGATEWDLIIVDEAHKLSATYFRQQGQQDQALSARRAARAISRHFLLMTATPHNGKEARLPDLAFPAGWRPLLRQVPRRRAQGRCLRHDAPHGQGRAAQVRRHAAVPRAPRLHRQLPTLRARGLALRAGHHLCARGDEPRRQARRQKAQHHRFRLTQLQRRLASSPEAIYQSLKRRRKRLEARLEETKLIARGQAVQHGDGHGRTIAETLGEYSVKKTLELPEDFDDLDEELSAEDYERFADQVVDQASAAETIPELEAEILILKDLEHQAQRLVDSGNDKKWEELSSLLQDQPEMFTASGSRRKLILFTEHKDTLNYLLARIQDLLGNPQAVRIIYGGTNRDERRKVQEEFRNDPEVTVLVATDAAGEGVNLQNANLMVNYDLPWNPNRLEQRFGRIHRIGQTEVCHLWNIVAMGTREGEVFQKLFDKIEVERAALGGKVFDVLGEAFDNVSLKDLLVEAIRYGDDPEVKARMDQVIDGALDAEHLRDILRRNALVDQHMGLEALYAVKEEMEKAEARKLQPYFIRAFFTEAFTALGGELRPREAGRFEVKHVPAVIRERVIG